MGIWPLRQKHKTGEARLIPEGHCSVSIHTRSHLILDMMMGFGCRRWAWEYVWFPGIPEHHYYQWFYWTSIILDNQTWHRSLAQVQWCLRLATDCVGALDELWSLCHQKSACCTSWLWYCIWDSPFRRTLFFPFAYDWTVDPLEEMVSSVHRGGNQ